MLRSIIVLHVILLFEKKNQIRKRINCRQKKTVILNIKIKKSQNCLVIEFITIMLIKLIHQK